MVKLETSRGSRRFVKSRTQRLALIGVFVSIYVVLVEFLPFISYGQINIRVADVLYGLAPFFPEEVLIAAPLATFISDTTSYLGAFDFVGSTCVVAVAIFFCARVQRQFSVLGGFVVLDLILSSWLSWLIWFVGTGGSAPFWIIAVSVFASNGIAEVILPYSFYKIMKSRLRFGVSIESSTQYERSENA